MRVVITGEAAARPEVVRQAVLGLGLECGSGDCVPLADLAGRLQQGPADLVLVVLGADPGAALAAIPQAAARTSAPVFAVGPAADAEQILQAIRGGAREYLRADNVYDELLAALTKMRQAGAPVLQWGTVLAVGGAKPGSGVTTVACNLAFALAGQHPGRVALAELGAGVPELALNLDLQPPHGVAELAEGWDRMDATLLKHALVEHTARLSVLAYKPDTLHTVLLDPRAMRQIVVLLRTMFEYTVLDLGHSTDPARLLALDLADKIVLVVGLEVPALRLARQWVRQLKDGGLSAAKLHVAANRYGQRKQFSWKRAQEALGLPIRAWIPDDPARVNQALNHGRPLLKTARFAAITRSFDKLARHLNGGGREAARVLAG